MNRLLRRVSAHPWLVAAVPLSLLAATAALTVVNRHVVVPGEEPWDARLVWALVAIPIPVIGALIASRSRGNPYGWVWLTMGFGFALQVYMAEYVFLGISRPRLPLSGVSGILAGLGWAVTFFSLPAVLLLFPTGRPPSPRWATFLKVVLVIAAVSIALGTFVPTEGVAPVANPLQATGRLGEVVVAMVGIGTIIVMASMVPAAISLFVRYRNADPVEKAQLKWFLWAAVVFVVMIAFDFVWELEGVWEALKEGIPLAFLPVAVAVAILKHNLYDIDRIVSRTVSYAVVTALLVGVYLSFVFVLGMILPTESDIAVAASTLAVAAAFNPVRRRVQNVVDRRFNRSRYDAAQTVERFSHRLRGATDMLSLGDELRGAVASVTEPAHMSLWLRETERSRS